MWKSMVLVKKYPKRDPILLKRENLRDSIHPDSHAKINNHANRQHSHHPVVDAVIESLWNPAEPDEGRLEIEVPGPKAKEADGDHERHSSAEHHADKDGHEDVGVVFLNFELLGLDLFLHVFL
jgi:hypothetical protein